MDLRKRKGQDKEEDDGTSKRRKKGEEEGGNEKNVSLKALRMRRYREKLKTQRRDKYDELKKKDAERNRKNRKEESKRRKRDEKVQEKQREKWRKKKNEQRAEKKGQKSETINTSKEKGSKHRLQRRTPEKTSQSLKKKENVLRVQNWRLRVKLKQDKNDSNSVIESDSTSKSTKSPFGSRATEYRALSKVKSNLPGTPRKKMKLIEKLINSPRTKTELCKKGILMSEKAKKKLEMSATVLKSVKRNIADLKPEKGTTPETKKTAYKSVMHCILDKTVSKYHKFGGAISSYLKVRQPRGKKDEKGKGWWKSKPRKKRKDRISESTKEKAKSFFLSLEISREVPNKKDVKSVEGQKVQQHIMTMTLADAFELFKQKYPNEKIGLTAFKKLKPPQVKRVSETSHKSCLCQICCNLSLKIDGISKYAEKGEEGLKEKLKGLNKTRISDISMCEYQGVLPAPNCLERKCQTCGPKKFTDFLAISTTADIMQWYRWEQVQVMNEDNTSKRVTSCVPKETSVGSFLEELEKDLQKYPGHIFRAKWQQNQVQTCINSLEEDAVIMLMDFSENYRCRFQNESQSAYFDQRQVTVHPFMCYYKDTNLKDEEEEKLLVKHSIIIMSNDIKHDAFAVKSFEKKALDVLSSEGKVINQVIKFSDGAACQYKGKNTFAHLSKDRLKVIHNYFETSHGKSPCDGLGAVVKSACYNAMISGKAVIGNAEAAYQFCKQKLEHDSKIIGKDSDRHISKRHIVYVDASEISREESGVKAIPGTRAIHSARNTGIPFKLQIRSLSCFCKGCNSTQGGERCGNAAYIEPWQTVEQKFLAVGPAVQGPTVNTPAVVEIPGMLGDGACVTNVQSNSSFGNREKDKRASKNKRVDERHLDNGSFDVKVDDFVLIELFSRRCKKTFAAKVLEVDGEEVHLSYMTRFKNAAFRWPDMEDTSWENVSNIRKLLSQPRMSKYSTNDRLCFEFDNL